MRETLMIIGLFLIVFITGADSFIISPLLPAIANDFSISISRAAFSITIYALCYACGSPFLGPLGDRLNRKALLKVGILVFLVGSFLCALANSISMFYIFRAIAGLGAALTLPNVWATIGAYFNGKRLNTVMGIVMSGLSLSIAVGVPIGTTLSQISDWHMAFWGSGLVTLIAFAVLLIVVPSMPIVNTKRSAYFASFKQLAKAPKAIYALLINFVWMFGFYSIYTFLGTFITQTFHLNTGQTGYVFIAYGLSNFAASFFGGEVTTRLGAKKSVILNGLLSVGFVLGLSIFQQALIVTILFLVLLALAQGFGVTALTTYIVNIVPKSRATVMSFNSSFLYLGLTFGSMIGGFIYPRYGFVGVGICAAIALALAVVLAQQISKKATDEF
ncbi:MFS transporter [Lactiplantibacillus pentosus]|uniref:MFS transporter n=2 Tax=Lactiplantibacillus pentosus TaxID=1589 RepID=UPI000B538CC4|nr:MFS transporter [Lactiplantibacillus pentosus]ASG81292.1 MFS transporter [Lactiplantibacillus pentosus]